jgi:hypothetical protein
MILLVVFVSILVLAGLLLLASRCRSRAKSPRKLFASIPAIVALGIIVGAIWMWKSIHSLTSGTSGLVWDKILWRAHLFGRKAEAVFLICRFVVA